jgi:U3 small nucleolar RNA-associated protein 19
MPALIDGKSGAIKRKRLDSKQKPIKRARSESSEEDSEEDGQARILMLENEVFESKKHYNNISSLIKLVRSEDDDSEDSIVAAIALCRIFTRLMASGDLTKNPDTSEKDSVVILWLRERYAEYKTALLELLFQEGLASTAFTLAMRMLKSEGTHLRNKQEYSFPTGFLSNIVEALISPEAQESIRQEFSEKYVEENDDVRFYTFNAIE